MLTSGHAGITLGAAVLLDGALAKGGPLRLKECLELRPEMRPAWN